MGYRPLAGRVGRYLPLYRLKYLPSLTFGTHAFHSWRGPSARTTANGYRCARVSGSGCMDTQFAAVLLCCCPLPCCYYCCAAGWLLVNHVRDAERANRTCVQLPHMAQLAQYRNKPRRRLHTTQPTGCRRYKVQLVHLIRCAIPAQKYPWWVCLTSQRRKDGDDSSTGRWTAGPPMPVSPRDNRHAQSRDQSALFSA